MIVKHFVKLSLYSERSLDISAIISFRPSVFDPAFTSKLPIRIVNPQLVKNFLQYKESQKTCFL
jgi:hypothetical protein